MHRQMETAKIVIQSILYNMSVKNPDPGTSLSESRLVDTYEWRLRDNHLVQKEHPTVVLFALLCIE